MIIIPALLLGFLGSFHCVGMCGPIALSLPVMHLRGWQKVLGILSYNLGRVVTYSVLGLIFGLLGKTMSFFSSQQILSIALGSLLVIMFIFQLLQRRLVKQPIWMSRWNQWLSKQMRPLFRSNNKFSRLILGMLNGLLPCGMVYMAAAGAVALSAAWKSSLFMAIFGLGTIPAMMAVSFAGSMMNVSIRNRMRQLTPYVIGIMGILLILRGLDLGIPYISPSMHGHAMHH